MRFANSFVRCVANPRWGAPRVHGEFLKLGMDVAQTTVATYMAKRRRPPSQGWRTFVHDHADAIASIDMFVVPTISFGLLYELLIAPRLQYHRPHRRRHKRLHTRICNQQKQGRCRTARAFVANLGRATPSICSSLSFRQGQARGI
jgi:hypothetical protein